MLDNVKYWNAKQRESLYLACVVRVMTHSFILAISIAPLQVLYYSEALPTTAWMLYRSFTTRAGVEPTTLRLKVIASTNAPPRPTSMHVLECPVYRLSQENLRFKLCFNDVDKARFCHELITNACPAETSVKQTSIQKPVSHQSTETAVLTFLFEIYSAVD